MRYREEFLSTAFQDIHEIEEYLSQFYPSTPLKFFKELDKKIILLRHMPHIGQKYKDFRRLVCGDYLIFYKVIEDDQKVVIYRILHGSRNIDDFLINS